MRKFALIGAVVLGLCGSAFGQDVPRIEIFGGYSYLNLDTNNLSPRQSAHGWEASLSGNVNRWFAVEGDVAGYYKTYTVDATSLGLGILNLKVHDYSFSAGPRINLRPLFFHALFGGDTLTGSASGFSKSQTGFACAFGGGVQWKVAPNIAVRGSADYILSRHNIFGGPRFTQNNIRASVGIVFTFGGTRQVSSGGRNQTTGVPMQTEPASEAALLGISGYATEAGVKITAVRAGSPAEQIFLKSGDVIVKIDGREVHTSRDIELAIGASASGKVKVSCLIQTGLGMMPSEREAKVR